tara:strand:- start:389 stop:829 length:441 start_codon:yes stop_codon:yes gene_type:complete
MGNTILLLELVLHYLQLVAEVILDVAVYFRQLQLQVEVVAVSIPHQLAYQVLMVAPEEEVVELVLVRLHLEDQEMFLRYQPLKEVLKEMMVVKVDVNRRIIVPAAVVVLVVQEHLVQPQVGDRVVWVKEHQLIQVQLMVLQVQAHL